MAGSSFEQRRRPAPKMRRTTVVVMAASAVQLVALAGWFYRPSINPGEAMKESTASSVATDAGDSRKGHRGSARPSVLHHAAMGSMSNILQRNSHERFKPKFANLEGGFENVGR